LTNLTSLKLYSNQLTGSIPSEIGTLTNLNRLYLYNNQLTGEIPSSIGNLNNLEFLLLDNNELSGLVPENLCGIIYINLGGNNLCSPYPECISDENIGYQDTSECFIGCIDGEEVELWGECYNIEETTEILLPSSQLTGEIPESIGNLINLNSLVLYNNQLTGEIPESIGNLIDLTWLNLYNNQLNGDVPESIGNLINLTSLDLGFNQFSGEIPQSLGGLINLNHLWLFNNQLNGDVPISICNIYQNLEHFYINNNQLCPPYPECLSEWSIGFQDISECGELSNSNYIIEYSLNQPYPNPFNPTTTISFSVPNYDFVSIKIYDINGGLVSTLVEDHFNQGTHSLTWDGTGLSSGQYLVKMESGSFSKTQIISLVK